MWGYKMIKDGEEIILCEKRCRIIIEGCDEDKMETLFEEIQNRYSLYDNCVIERNISNEETIMDKECFNGETGGYVCEECKDNQFYIDCNFLNTNGDKKVEK